LYKKSIRLPILNTQDQNLGAATVREAILSQLWIKDIAYNLDHDLLHEYFRLWIAIQSTQLHLHDSREDEIMWTLEGSGPAPNLRVRYSQIFQS
jgi:hypothetical protein